ERAGRAWQGARGAGSRRGAGSACGPPPGVGGVAPAGAEAQAGSPSARAVPTRPLHILCVEDNPYGRVVLNTILTELGHRADFVGTGEAAVEAAAGKGYDAGLMELTLPGMAGVEATRRICVRVGT